MAAVLTDIHLAEAVLAKKQMDGKPAQELAEIYYDSLFAKYNITRSMFDSSLVFYSRYPEAFNEIYSVVIKNLSKIESDSTDVKINSEEEAENSLNKSPR